MVLKRSEIELNTISIWQFCHGSNDKLVNYPLWLGVVSWLTQPLCCEWKQRLSSHAKEVKCWCKTFQHIIFCLDVLDCAVSKWGRSHQPGLKGERVELSSRNDQGCTCTWICTGYVHVQDMYMNMHGTFAVLWNWNFRVNLGVHYGLFYSNTFIVGVREQKK